MLIYNSTSPSSGQKLLWDIKFIILVDALIILNAFKCINTIWPFLAMPFCQNPSSGDIKVTFLVEGFLFIFSYRYVGGEKLFLKNKLYSLFSPFPKRCKTTYFGCPSCSRCWCNLFYMHSPGLLSILLWNNPQHWPCTDLFLRCDQYLNHPLHSHCHNLYFDQARGVFAK